MGDPNGDFFHRLYPAQAVKSMVKDCDFVLVTLPLTDKTRGMINADVLAACKPSAYLIDTSRGGIVNHDALIRSLNDKKLAGAALDVFPEEPLPNDSPLWGMPNVIITPHIAGISTHYDKRAVELFAENLSRYIADLPLYNIFDLKKGY
jgi:phosphoglycerate dehydrogenase-like enzyme